MANQNFSPKNGDIKFKIVTLNVRGLRSLKKRRSLFHLLNKNDYCIICLQETYLLKTDKHIIEKEWGSKFHLAEGSKRSKGLLTLLNNRFPVSCFSLVSESDRCITSKICIDDTCFYILNVYAPCINADKQLFLNKIVDNINQIQSNPDANFLILGDFNMVLENKIDIIAGEYHNEGVVRIFNDFVTDLLLVDVWRYLNGKKQEFSWSKSKPFIARRLDYIFSSEQLLTFCKTAKICQLGFSDHKAVVLNIDFSSFRRGPSFYKFNISLLHDKVLIDAVTAEIKRIKLLDLNPHLKWEYIKASIKDIGKMYGRTVAFEKRKTQKILNEQISDLERHLITSPNDESAVQHYNELKKKLEIMTIREADGARIRSGQKWAQEGEKCTKYFLNLEKQRSWSNTIFSIEGESGEIIRNPEEILKYLSMHFKNIYKEEVTKENSEKYDLFVNDKHGNLLDENDKLTLNKDLTINELLTSLKNSNNKSAPGSDGLPGEVYKFFWNDLKDPLLECFLYSLEVGHLCKSQTTGIICLHFKGKGLAREVINNWRPISLTNFDYKLLAKAMAMRLNSCISKCIKEDQYAFIKGRLVGDLLREIDDILELGKIHFPNSIILSLDYAKAFDSISISSIKKALSYFGFDGTFMKWVDLLLHHRQNCIQNGGYLSEFFNMERGVRQGCPISPLFFILTLELLARDIRKNDVIKGLRFGDRAIKVKLYADDATLFLRDMIDYREVLSRIKMFSSFSGLLLNKKKSAAMYIGNTGHKNSFKCGIKFYNQLKILGVLFSNECIASDIPENYEGKIQQLEKLCSLWGKRCLTIYGRITVLKSFGLSLFIYLMQSIGLSDDHIKRINTIFYSFIWSPTAKTGKKVTEKVKRETINKRYEHGGMNMTDIKKLQDSFRLKWADRLFSSSNNSWQDIPNIYFKKLGGIAAFMSDVVSSDFIGLDLIASNFWKKVLITWLDYKNSEKDTVKTKPSINDPLFNNSCMQYKNQILFNSACIDLNLIYIRDFLKQGGVITFREFNDLFPNKADSLLFYFRIYNALMRFDIHFKNEITDGVVQ